MILVTDRTRPLPRSGKHTIVRKKALALYSKEIQLLCVALTDIQYLHRFMRLTLVIIVTRSLRRVLQHRTRHTRALGIFRNCRAG